MIIHPDSYQGKLSTYQVWLLKMRLCETEELIIRPFQIIHQRYEFYGATDDEWEFFLQGRKGEK